MCWIIGLLLLLALLVGGILLGRKARKEIPARLAEAKAAWARDDVNETLRLLDGAFIGGGHYSSEEARRALEVVALAEQASRKKGTTIQDVSSRLKGALETAAQSTGGDVPSDLASPFKKFLEHAAKKPDRLVEALTGATSKLVTLDPEDHGPRSVGEPTSEQASAINKIGRSIVFGGPDEALKLIEAALPGATGVFKVDLLSQRGGCLLMKKDSAGALADYQACCELEPDNSTHFTNLAETFEKLGRSDEARAAATKAGEVARTKVDKESAQAILRRLV